MLIHTLIGTEHKISTSVDWCPQKIAWCIFSFYFQEEVPFDKDHIRAQIMAGGGVVLSKYDKDAVREPSQETVIVWQSSCE